jgi:ubiquinone/menaquinone biosynthesis C-methylase UbiE
METLHPISIISGEAEELCDPNHIKSPPYALESYQQKQLTPTPHKEEGKAPSPPPSLHKAILLKDFVIIFNYLRRSAPVAGGYDDWDRIYRSYPLEALPWELGRPREALVELVERGGLTMEKVLDLCCGAGTNSVYMAGRGLEVTAMDISPKAVAYAKERAAQAGVDITFMVRSFLELPFPDGEFDLALDSGCFHHVLVDDRGAFIRGVHRVLKPGGKYLLICFSERNGPAWNHFTLEEIGRLFSGLFEVLNAVHSGSLEGDGVVRYFHNVLMAKA